MLRTQQLFVSGLRLKVQFGGHSLLLRGSLERVRGRLRVLTSQKGLLETGKKNYTASQNTASKATPGKRYGQAPLLSPQH